MTSVSWLPPDPPPEYLGSDLYGAFADDPALLFSDNPEVDFRKTSVREMIRAVRYPATFAGNREQTAETASLSGEAELVRKTATEAAKEAAREALGLRARVVPTVSAIHWVVRDCGVRFCDVEGAWQEIRRPHEGIEPRRYSVSVRFRAGRSEPGTLVPPTVQTWESLALGEIEVAADELCVLLPTSGLVAAWVWTQIDRCYRLATARMDAAAVFPVSFPEAAALGLVDENGIRSPFDGNPRGPSDILRTELLALPQSQNERVWAAVEWLLGRLAQSASGERLSDLARDEARKVLGLGARPSGQLR